MRSAIRVLRLLRASLRSCCWAACRCARARRLSGTDQRWLCEELSSGCAVYTAARPFGLASFVMDLGSGLDEFGDLPLVEKQKPVNRFAQINHWARD
jgi:hypothetical protein